MVLGMRACIRDSPAFLCQKIPDHVWAEASCCLRGYSAEEARKAKAWMPVSLAHLPALSKSSEWGVEADVAWLLMLVEQGALKASVPVDMALQSRHGRQAGDAECFHVKKLLVAREEHRRFMLNRDEGPGG